jgi:hypothetical protein
VSCVHLRLVDGVLTETTSDEVHAYDHATTH